MASILIVCTGNICRSPMAEGFLQRLLGERRLRASIRVSSSGIAGLTGSTPMPEAVVAAGERGADISHHVARRFDPGEARQADLVLAMTGGHRARVIDLAPDAASRTFTLKELVRLLEELPDPAPKADPGDVLRRRVAEADALRRSGFEGNAHDEDVPDPMGMPQQTYDAVAWDIDEWCTRLVAGLFGGDSGATGELEDAPAGRIPAAPPRPDIWPGGA